jgi:hypothetical protein
MKRKLTLSAIAFVAALPAMVLAQEGKEQIANILGVEANEFTLSELLQMETAASAGDRETVEKILAESNSGLTAEQVIQRVTPENATKLQEVRMSDYNYGKLQIANSIGVDPDYFTLAELVELQDAIDNKDADTVKLMIDRAGLDVTAEQLIQ